MALLEYDIFAKTKDPSFITPGGYYTKQQDLRVGMFDELSWDKFTKPKFLKIPEKDMCAEFGCAVRFSDFSFLYICGKKAVEYSIINFESRILPGELNYYREEHACEIFTRDQHDD